MDYRYVDSNLIICETQSFPDHLAFVIKNIVSLEAISVNFEGGVVIPLFLSSQILIRNEIGFLFCFVSVLGIESRAVQHARQVLCPSATFLALDIRS